MARPKKVGLDYFPHDCDASHDEKICYICSIHGKHTGYSIIFRLYERIYKEGGKLDISAAETMQILSRNVADMEIDKFSQFLKDCAKVKIFDENALNQGILTSEGILKRCAPIFDKREEMAKLYQKRVSGEFLPQKVHKVE